MRDHSVRWDGHQWRQVLAGGAAGEALLYGYSSKDLVHWSWDGPVLQASDANLPGQVWECPDVFTAGDHVVAIVSVMDGDERPVIWMTGAFDGERLIPRRWGPVDYGDRLYAPQSYSDHSGRRIMFGWLKTQSDEAALGQASIGVASLPRILSVVDGRLHQEPAVEIQQRRGDARRFTVDGDDVALSIPVAATPALEIKLTCESAEDLLGLRAELQDHAGHRMTIDLAMFSTSDRCLTPDGWALDHRESRGATLIFDVGIVEVFLDDGRAAAVSDARLGDISYLHVRRTGQAPVAVTIRSLAPRGTD
jgi:beta-fructofuranosidase